MGTSGDVVELIMNDHREVERLFDQLKKNQEKRPGLVPVLTALLTAHSRAEEAEVYPVARNEAGETEEIAHSQEEHAQADQLLEQLAATDPMSSEFDQVLDQLVEAVTHHVQEEESKVLPGMKERLDDKRLEELGEAFLTVRKKHLGDPPKAMTKQELQQQAKNVGLEGASDASKEELKQQLRSSSS